MKTAAIIALVLTAGAASAQNATHAEFYNGTIGNGQDFGNHNNHRNTVIYDTLSIANNQSYDNGNGNAWSGTAIFGAPSDLQLSDDFMTTGNNVITQVTADFLTFLGGTPAGGLQVDVFQDLGGTPSEAPVASQTVPVTAASSFTDTIFGLAGRRLTADVNIPLSANTSYYIMIQPIDLTSGGDWYYQVNDYVSNGGDVHLRDGGRGATGYGSFTWITSASNNGSVGTSGMQIVAVPAPSALALLGLGGLAAARRRR